MQTLFIKISQSCQLRIRVHVLKPLNVESLVIQIVHCLVCVFKRYSRSISITLNITMRVSLLQTIWSCFTFLGTIVPLLQGHPLCNKNNAFLRLMASLEGVIQWYFNISVYLKSRSSANKTEYHVITEIMLKVALNTITLTLTLKSMGLM